MALMLNFWEADGPKGETLHHDVRLKRLADKEPIMKEFRSAMSQGSIVLVTVDRSDTQSPWSKIEWIKPGYENKGSLA